MKKNTLKIIALALSIGSLGSIQAMNQRARLGNIILILASTAPSALATAWLCHNPEKSQSSAETSTTNNNTGILGTAAAYAAAFPIATLSSIAAHELGHATMASIVNPGSVEKIKVGLLGGETHFKTSHVLKWSKPSFMSMLAAGPAAGVAFCYAGIKGLQVFDEYQKTNDLKQAIEIVREKPVLETSDSTFTKAMQHCLFFNAFAHIENYLSTNRMGTDGTYFLRAALFGDAIKAVPKKASFLWNSALLLGTGYGALKLKNSYAQYQEEQAELALKKKKEQTWWKFW